MKHNRVHLITGTYEWKENCHCIFLDIKKVFDK